MTTIAYDGETLAVDEGVWVTGGLVNRGNKLFRIDGERGGWYAASGDAGMVELMQAWLAGGAKPDIPEADRRNAYGMFVADDGRAFEVTGYCTLYELLNRPVAAGAGREIAMGAMLAGASADEAVRIVERCSENARGCRSVRIERKSADDTGKSLRITAY